MDPLSHVLAQLRPQAAGWQVIEAHDAWTIRFPPRSDIVIFGQALSGDCDIVREDGRTLHVSTGDFMLMASPPAWEMHALGGGPPVDFKTLLAEPTRLARGEAKVVTRFIAGHFSFATSGAELLSRLIAPIVLIQSGDVVAERLGALLTLLRQEAGTDRAASTVVIKLLLELLLVEVLRSPAAGLHRAGSGLLAGLADPKMSRALTLIHGDMRRVWTVGEIARAVGMSRSVFAARFTEIIGSPPMEYIASWRMTLAKQALLARTEPMTKVADLAGYRSVSAFSTAFRRSTGVSPTGYVRSSAGHTPPGMAT